VAQLITCKLAGKIGQAIKAHVVPRAFYELPTQEEGAMPIGEQRTEHLPKETSGRSLR
jgi:hypothetical protein